MKRVYLDYAASTPVDPRVLHAMEPYFAEKFGNPGSLHYFGQETMAAVDASREAIAKSIGADFREIIFTGSATEANNLVLRGALKAFRFQLLGFSGNEKKVLTAKSYMLKPRIIVSAIEHESILETASDLEKYGVEIVYLPVDRQGVVDLHKLKSSLNERTVLVSVMYANNEIGTIQPISKIAQIIREFRMENLELRGKRRPQPSILNSQFFFLFHTDAAQAFQFLDCDIEKLGIDLMTLSAHKIYGPKGIGALYIKHGTWNMEQKIRGMLHAPGFVLHPIVTGGGQEFGLRSGTENVPTVVGFAKAVELLGARLPAGGQELETIRIRELRNYFWQELKKIVPEAELNGDLKNSLPNILNVYFPHHEAEELLTKFDLAGLAASSGSACRSRAAKSSYVIKALGYPNARAERSIRFSFGRPTTEKEITAALAIVKRCLAA